MNPCDINTNTGHPIEIVDLGRPAVTLGPRNMENRMVTVYELDEPEIVYNPIDKKGYVKYFGIIEIHAYARNGPIITLWDGYDFCPESGLVDCATDHCSIHAVDYSDVDIKIVTQADAIRAELVEIHGLEKVELLEAQEQKKVRVNHCSRCGAIHRRALATLNGRCYNCRYFSRRLATLTKIRLALRDDE